jgi:hypothetical protein
MVAAGAATASAQPEGPSVAYAGHLTGGPGAVTLGVTYTCSDSAGSFDHLFAAVKQGPLVGPDYPFASSDFADTFYSTNWKSDSGPNALVCDGTQHSQMLVLKPQPGFVPKVPRLSSGPALVQLCLYDNVTQVSDEGEPLDGGFAPSYTMQLVHAGNGASK